MADETSDFYTTLWSPRMPHKRKPFHWVRYTYDGAWYSAQDGDLGRFLRQQFGWSTVGSMSTAAVFVTNFPVLVDGELWTDESVFWQGKLKDGEEYMTVHCTGNPSAPEVTF